MALKSPDLDGLASGIDDGSCHFFGNAHGFGKLFPHCVWEGGPLGVGPGGMDGNAGPRPQLWR